MPTRPPSKGRRPAPKGSASQKAAPQPGSPLRHLFDGHGHDLWGLGLILLAVLSALAVWFGGGAVVGRGIDSFLGAVFGVLAVLVPVALAAAGALLIRGPRPATDLREAEAAAARSHATSGPDDTLVLPAHPPRHTSKVPRSVSITVGLVLAALVVAGVAHLFAAEGRSVTDDGFDAYRGAGGLLGALTAGGLQGVIGRWGALAVLVCVAVVAVSLLSGWSLRRMADVVGRHLGVGIRRLSRWLAGLFTVGDEATPPDQSSPEGRPHLYDQDADAPPAKPSRRRRNRASRPTVEVSDPGETVQLDLPLGPAAEGSPWKLPPPKLLSVSGKRSVDTKAVEQRGQILQTALADHGVQTRLVGMVVGPTVTRYELELGTGVKVAKVTALHRDIAYAMASADVRIIAPIPGRQAIGVEVPNAERQVVAVGDILVSDEAHRATHPLEVAVGRDINGRAVMMNLATMPHLLIAGQTGAGKSSCINSIITSIMMRSIPDQVRMILVDPKRVELTQYDRIPHLLTQVVANPRKAANALNWAVKEMERRYDLLHEAGVRDITGYNAAVDRGDLTDRLGEEREFPHLPFILVVVDELSDLMMVAPRDVEESICRIAQMARAVGIHLVIATQRPSVNVITGVIKANIPARLAFAVSSATDSKVILDQAGAERLIGQGDMLLLGPASSAAQRIQGAWVEEKEVRTIVDHWRSQAPEVEAHYVEGVEGSDDDSGGASAGTGGGEDDDLLTQAMELVVRSQLGSTSMLQRKLKVGFARAGRLMDLLEQRGVVGPSEGSKAREVLMTVEEFEQLVDSGAI
jgi:S-DNA-T family DNA segregation ATPase FtsK/SpoIIIE